MNLTAKAAALDCSELVVVDLARRDPRITDPRSLAGDGATKTARWLRDGQPSPDHERALVLGDRGGRELVDDLCAAVPAPVASFARCEVAFLFGGLGSQGWARGPVPAIADRHLVVVSVADLAVLAHELAHCWTVDAESWTQPDTASIEAENLEWRQAVAACRDIDRRAAAEGIAELREVDRLFDRAVGAELRLERLADAAASCWLGERVDTVGRLRAERMRARLERLAKGVP